ncbi:glycoside hydrolase family 43 protein [Paenibacillus sp. y28]|uniref:glycoside hydrolase family 43 protein n=1 Tax=Paenibacillus sp. y28 TaxID=3129110 RepID=UPI0030164806
MLLEDINLRDPFILPVPEEQAYYLYGTAGATAWSGTPEGFPVYRSSDLTHWEGPFQAFQPPAGFWADRHFWAPEVHRWNGRYYMLASFKSEQRCRGTQILAADQPQGPFEPLGDRPVTPADWECLDGTLYADEDGVPWLVFCREWLEVLDGEVYAMPLLPDLTAGAAEPVLLFRASEAAWARPVKGDDHFVTDGPFLHRLPDGSLVMLWSSIGEQGYAMGLARSAGGRMTGPWSQEAEPVFAKDGGHGMLLRTLEGRLLLTIHTPNKNPLERPILLKVEEAPDGISLPQMPLP